MAGEIGVIFNIPQPFTVRRRRLSQVIRISHHDFKQMVQQHGEDGSKIINNFIQYLKGLKQDVLEEIPFLTELLSDLTIEHSAPNEGTQNHEALSCHGDSNVEGTQETSTTVSSTLPIRVIVHGHHPNENAMEDDTMGKLINLPDSIEDLFRLAEKTFGKRGSTILMADGSEVEELSALRENDHPFIF